MIKELKQAINYLYLCKIKYKGMGYLGVQDRFQIQMSSMEEFIDKEKRCGLGCFCGAIGT